MRWDLFALCFAVWIAFGAHYVLASRVRQAMSIGFVEPSGTTTRLLGLSKVLSVLAFLNALVFAAVFGWKVSWVGATGVVLGSYATSLLYAFLTRGSTYDGLLNLTHKIGWIVLPLCSVSLWLFAFDGRPRDLETCIQTYAVPAVLPRAVQLAEQTCARTLDEDVVGTELQRELCVLQGARSARNEVGLRTLRTACARAHPANESELRRVAEREWLRLPVCPRADSNLYANPADLTQALRPFRSTNARTICGFKSYRSLEHYFQGSGFMLAPPPGYYFENNCAIRCRFNGN